MSPLSPTHDLTHARELFAHYEHGVCWPMFRFQAQLADMPPERREQAFHLMQTFNSQLEALLEY